MAENSSIRPELNTKDSCQWSYDGRTTKMRQTSRYSEPDESLVRKGIVADRIRNFQESQGSNQASLAETSGPSPIPAISLLPVRLSTQRNRNQIGLPDEDKTTCGPQKAPEFLAHSKQPVVKNFYAPQAYAREEPATPKEAHLATLDEEGLGKSSHLILREDSRRIANERNDIIRGNGLRSASITDGLAQAKGLHAQPQSQTSSREDYIRASPCYTDGGRQAESLRQPHLPLPFQSSPAEQEWWNKAMKDGASAIIIDHQPSSSGETSHVDLSPPSRSHLHHHRRHHAHESFQIPEDWPIKKSEAGQPPRPPRPRSKQEQVQPRGGIAGEIAAMIDRAIEGRSDSFESFPVTSPNTDHQSLRSRLISKKVDNSSLVIKRSDCSSACSKNYISSLGKPQNIQIAAPPPKPHSLSSISSYNLRPVHPRLSDIEHHGYVGNAIAPGQPTSSDGLEEARLEESLPESPSYGSPIAQPFSDPITYIAPQTASEGRLTSSGARASQYSLGANASDQPRLDAVPDDLYYDTGVHGRKVKPRTPDGRQSRLPETNNSTPSALPKQRAFAPSKAIPIRSSRPQSQLQIGHSRRLRWWKLILSEKMPTNVEIERREERELHSNLHARPRTSRDSGEHDLYSSESYLGDNEPVIQHRKTDRRSPFESTVAGDEDPFIDRGKNGGYVELYGAFDGSMDALENALGGLNEPNEPDGIVSDLHESPEKVFYEASEDTGERYVVVVGKRKISGVAHPVKEGGVKVIINVGERLKEAIRVDLQPSAGAVVG